MRIDEAQQVARGKLQFFVYRSGGDDEFKFDLVAVFVKREDAESYTQSHDLAMSSPEPAFPITKDQLWTLED